MVCFLKWLLYVVLGVDNSAARHVYKKGDFVEESQFAPFSEGGEQQVMFEIK
ncbi:MAG: hypothetical protein UW09_C0001G0331 [candidate division TM6 bacterium GW2011_GWF2_43_87]|nr:MAG: hypothetical protein UW09_C0001G0331 [candidate division TM6 bacterium GW2011_GWF2_43_87]